VAIRQTLSRPVPLQVAGTIEAHVGADIAMVFDFVPNRRISVYPSGRLPILPVRPALGQEEPFRRRS